MYKIKIALFLPNLQPGGAEKVSVNLANRLCELGYRVDMVLLSASGPLISELHPTVNVVNLQVRRLRWTLPPLLNYIRKSKPDSLLACMWPLTAIAVFAKIAFFSKLRVIVSEHTTWSKSQLLSRKGLTWRIKKSMQYLFPKANGIVTVSQGAAKDLSNFANIPSGLITVIYNPIVADSKPVQSTIPMSPTNWWEGSHFKILSVGTLKPVKDHSTLIDAFQLIRNSMDARLLILGEGECRDELTKKIELLNLKDSVFIPGFVRQPDKYYLQADLFVLSSISEGLSNVIIEALAAGTQIVSTDCPSGPREILLNGKYGKLVPVGDAKKLAEACISTLLEPSVKIDSVNAVDRFLISTATNKYIQLLDPSNCNIA